jgi:hypothetical protein
MLKFVTLNNILKLLLLPYTKLMSNFLSTKPGQLIVINHKKYILLNKFEWKSPTFADSRPMVCVVIDPKEDKSSHRPGTWVNFTPLYFVSVIKNDEVI